MRRYLDNKTLDEVAIARIRSFESEAVEMHPDGYWLAFSGGKDSVVILDLAERAGVKFETHHNLTTCDPPELVEFVRTFRQVEIDHPPLSMWQLIRKWGMPPRRQARFCCRELKERGGTGRLVITGVRWSESSRRASRQMTEACYRDKTKRYLHPVIDWPTSAVWEYIHERTLPYCRLYDEGWKRVGCVLCPYVRDVEKHMARWPKLARAWELAVKATWKNPLYTWHKYRHQMLANGGGAWVAGAWLPMLSRREWLRSPLASGAFRTAEEYWQWWLDRDAPSRKDDDPVLFEDDPSLIERQHEGEH